MRHGFVLAEVDALASLTLPSRAKKPASGKNKIRPENIEDHPRTGLARNFLCPPISGHRKFSSLSLSTIDLLLSIGIPRRYRDRDG